MIDFFKELADAANSRIRSPFIGSIVLVFLSLNWKAISVLLFSSGSIELKVLTFDGMTSFSSLVVLPVLLGVVIALILPWSRLLGALIAKRPAGMLKRLQHDESQSFRIYQLNGDAAEAEGRARLDEATERAKIDAAKRLEDARNLDQNLEAEIIEDRKASENEKGDTTLVKKWSEEVLNFAASSNHGQIVMTDIGVENLDREILVLPKWSGSHRDVKNLRDVLQSLYLDRLLESAGSTEVEGYEMYEITSKGYRRQES